ncbi:hypothetical protein [Actinocorallia longicatena]|uniref:Uncharacterized protein n=1 Tax=Actinocorallia longicatena TaxID=111803 RepID=A0ABP6QKZ0_9ACTN
MADLGRRFYGIAEIAQAIGVERQLVTVWRRRSSHDMPPPDDELTSGPVWTAATIEPWVIATRARLSNTGTPAGEPVAVLARRYARRLFRLLALLLQEPRNDKEVLRTLSGLGQLHPAIAEAAMASGLDSGARRDLAELAALAQAAADVADGAAPEAELGGFLDRCLPVAPAAARLLSRATTE